MIVHQQGNTGKKNKVGFRVASGDKLTEVTKNSNVIILQIAIFLSTYGMLILDY